MIVKTGANYQAEGGYIEASREGDAVVVTSGDDRVEIPTIKGVGDAMVKCVISKGEGVPNGGNYTGVENYQAQIPLMAGHSLPNYPNSITIGVFFHIGTPLALPNNANVKLLDGSKDCVLSPGWGNNKLLLATGNNPVAVLGVEE